MHIGLAQYKIKSDKDIPFDFLYIQYKNEKQPPSRLFKFYKLSAKSVLLLLFNVQCPSSKFINLQLTYLELHPFKEICSFCTMGKIYQHYTVQKLSLSV